MEKETRERKRPTPELRYNSRLSNLVEMDGLQQDLNVPEPTTFNERLVNYFFGPVLLGQDSNRTFRSEFKKALLRTWYLFTNRDPYQNDHKMQKEFLDRTRPTSLRPTPPLRPNPKLSHPVIKL